MENSEKGDAQKIYLYVGCGSGDVGGTREHLHKRGLEKRALDSCSRSHAGWLYDMAFGRS